MERNANENNNNNNNKIFFRFIQRQNTQASKRIVFLPPEPSHMYLMYLMR